MSAKKTTLKDKNGVQLLPNTNMECVFGNDGKRLDTYINDIKDAKADKTYVDTQDALKIDKTQIKNTLTETVVGNVLDATQGKIIDDKITVLQTDKADKNNAQLTGTATLNSKSIATTETPTIVFKNNWLATDAPPCASLTGKQLTINARVKGGDNVANTTIMSTGVTTNVGNQFFEAKSLTGTFLGMVYVHPTGDIRILNALTSNTDVLINISMAIK